MGATKYQFGKFSRFVTTPLRNEFGASRAKSALGLTANKTVFFSGFQPTSHS
jgi:hypothetical protein